MVLNFVTSDKTMNKIVIRETSIVVRSPISIQISL